MDSVDSLLRSARQRLPAGEAELLLGHVLHRGPAWLYAHGDHQPDGRARDAFEALVARRVAGEPVAYLTGQRGFWRFELQVGPDTLIPRPETERLVELALERMPSDRALHVADLGTGSGAIALALALERPRARVEAVDASKGALAVARANAARLGVGNIAFRQGSWWQPLAGLAFDLVASNPPYIAEADPHLAEGDLRHEPRAALASGVDGLDDLRAIVCGASAHLKPAGWLLVEHGWDQGAPVRTLFQQAGLVDVATETDLEARDRVTLGRRPA